MVTCSWRDPRLKRSASQPDDDVMTTNGVPSLEEFAADRLSGARRCVLCSVAEDVEREVRAAKESGVTYQVIAEWMTAKGYGGDSPVTKGRLEKHFQLRHRR